MKERPELEKALTLAREFKAAAPNQPVILSVQGVYDPNGAGAIVFAALAVAAEVEREGIREKTLEGLDTAARKGNHGGRPSVVDDDKLALARARHAKGESVTAIAKALGISRATLYRHIGESA
ncbi:helix-turn-helix domain-containing protein [Streptomyces sp. NPDC004838]